MGFGTRKGRALAKQSRDRGTDDGAVMPLGAHLEDLRRRLILAVLGVVPIVLIAFAFGRPIVELLIRPVQDALREAGMNPTLQTTGLFEMFGAYIRVSMIAAIVVGSPWLLWQLWQFIAPGLYKQERRFVYFLVPFSALLSMVGVVFLYFVILPVILSFFIHFGANVGDSGLALAQPPAETVFGEVPVLNADPIAPEPGQVWINDPLKQIRIALPAKSGEGVRVLGSALTEAAGIVPQYRISEYVKSFLSMALAFGAGFQLPVVVLLLGWAGIVDRAWFVRYRKQAVLACVVVAAVLTPADPFSMTLLAIPLYLLFELGVFLLLVLPPARVARGFWRFGSEGETDEYGEFVDDDGSSLDR